MNLEKEIQDIYCDIDVVESSETVNELEGDSLEKEDGEINVTVEVENTGRGNHYVDAVAVPTMVQNSEDIVKEPVLDDREALADDSVSFLLSNVKYLMTP